MYITFISLLGYIIGYIRSYYVITVISSNVMLSEYWIDLNYGIRSEFDYVSRSIEHNLIDAT